MEGHSGKRISKIEDAETETFAGKIPVKSDEDRNDTIRTKGSWCWLLAPDGTPATVQSSCQNKSIKGETSNPRNDPKTEPTDDRAAKSEFVPGDGTPPSKKYKRDPVLTSNSRWCWLLAPDGTQATVAARAEKTPMPGRPRVKKKSSANMERGRRIERTTRSNSIHVDGTIVRKQFADGKLYEGEVIRYDGRTKWYKIKYLDGEEEDMDEEEMKRYYKQDQKYSHEEYGERSTKAQVGMSRDVSSPAAAERNDERKRKNPWVHGSWCWLLAPDGTPATVNHSTPSRAKKRKRADLAQGEQRASRPRRSCRENWIFNVADEKPIETDDEDSVGSAADGDDIDNVYDSHYAKNRNSQWQKKFQLLVEYKNKHKTTSVPLNHPTLGNWIHNQRNIGQKNLKEDRRQCLESIGFVFNTHAIGWMDMYNQLLLYKDKHNGSVNVPHKTDKSNKVAKLANWMHRQRLLYNSDTLLEERKSLLESIGFDWQLQKGRDDNNGWMEMYQRLVAYKQKYKTTRVPARFEACPKLGRWVRVQRSTSIKEERTDLLNYIGFEWDPLGNDWMVMYRRLLAYQEKYKSTCVPYHFEADPKLGMWVDTQRRYCTKKDRIDLLNDIGFVWDGRTPNKNWRDQKSLKRTDYLDCTRNRQSNVHGHAYHDEPG